MEKTPRRRSLRERIPKGDIQRRDVLRRLAELAFGKPNDCVRLVVEESVDIDSLELGLLREVKRCGNGSVEIKLVDQLQILEQLAALTEKEEPGVEDFLKKLRDGGQDA